MRRFNRKVYSFRADYIHIVRGMHNFQFRIKNDREWRRIIFYGALGIGSMMKQTGQVTVVADMIAREWR